uniref:ATP synthase F0 subunit 6 n=1 Tax=Julodis variolaris TaxID=3025997 RepID=UPI0023AB3F0B|nr:ATP synthase F0 subunit 6 [Julodis variolaris]WCO87683.1 ATP synthase F0 subunit 6 [Julodis variolaris]
MMTNLFSSFDPAANFSMPLNWLSTFLGLMFIPSFFWFIPSRFNMIWHKIIFAIHTEFKILLGTSKMNGSTLIFAGLFSFILFNNFLGLFPYVFTSTSHFVLNLTLALPLWLAFMIFGWINNTIHMFAHLLPQGVPGILMPFMVCIETISNLIRPGTLAIRLTANMIAGHLLLTLMSNTGNYLSIISVNLLIVTQVIFLILESAVAVIQAYVFAALSTLYSSEVN